MRSIAAILCPVLLAGGLLPLLASCNSDEAQPIVAQDFYSRNAPPSSPSSALDTPGILPLPDTHAQAPAPRHQLSQPTAGEVEKSVPAFEPATQPTTRTASSAAQPKQATTTFATDQYMTLGSVVVVINGTPIFANKVLRVDQDRLRSLARRMNREDFRDAAYDDIDQTVKELKRDELEVAAAERTLDPKDIQLAHALTTLWSKNQVAEAGGSEQVVRLRALASGESFEEQEQDQYRHYLQGLYYLRKIDPEIVISPEDMRKYYRAHIDEFSTPRQANIILIESDPARFSDNPASAKAKLAKIRQRGLAGEDFASFGKLQNDLPGAEGPEGNGGQMTLKPNSFILTNVDAAVWTTPVGHISNIIEDHDAFYIVKVVSRDEGGVKPFSDAGVQEAINKHLADVQRTQRRDAEIFRLEKEGIDPTPNLDPVLEMAMQNYSKWSKQ